MNSRFYQAPGLDVERIASELTNALQAQGYQAQQFGNKGQTVVQMRKGGDFEAFLGLQAAITITLQKAPEGVVAIAGQQKWLDKAAVGAVGFFFPPLWPLTITATLGLFRQVGVESDLFQLLDTIVLKQHAHVHIGGVPPHMQPSQWPPQGPPWQAQAPQQQRGPAAVPHCPHCQFVNEPGDRFCSHCGKSLEVPRARHCPRCQAPIRPNIAFCTRCGLQLAPEQPAAASAPAAEPVAANMEQHAESVEQSEVSPSHTPTQE